MLQAELQRVRDERASDFAQRKQAAEALEKMGAKAVPQIEAEVRRTNDPEVRWQTRRLLRRLGGKNSGLKPSPRVRQGTRTDRSRLRGLGLPREFDKFLRGFGARTMRDQDSRSSSSSTKINITPDGVEVEISETAPGPGILSGSARKCGTCIGKALVEEVVVIKPHNGVAVVIPASILWDRPIADIVPTRFVGELP